MFNKFILSLINIIHLLVILFVFIAPFTNSTILLLLHAIIIPFIMLHWILNNDTCAITEIEKIMRKKINGGKEVNQNDCFSYKIISPIYNFLSNNPNYSKLSWFITILLWSISIYKLQYHKEQIKEIINIYYNFFNFN
jgi:hypothetical protein